MCKIKEEDIQIKINAGSTGLITLNDSVYCIGYIGRDKTIFIENSMIFEP